MIDANGRLGTLNSYGQALTARHHVLASMLLDALQREHRSNVAQATRLDGVEQQVARLLQGR